MSTAPQPVVTLGDLPLDAWERGDLYAAADNSFTDLLGLRDLAVRFNIVPPGKSSCPFHSHHVEEEMFVILKGSGTYRYGTSTHPVKEGDVLGAPNGGPETAHQIINTGGEPLVYLGISTNSPIEVCEYPDSGKFLAYSRPSRRTFTEDKVVRHMGRPGNSLDYWDGEPRS